jgi:prepilin-type N-terminal cleavage/methylation domain-containing protein
MKRLASACRAAAGGFTLVELLVVMGIIGLLVGLLIPAVNYAITAGRVAATKNTISGISAGLYTFKADWNMFPPSSRKSGRIGAESQYDWRYGYQSLALYLIGPQGNGWGAGNGKRSPFDSVAVAQFGPYFQAEQGANIAAVRDNFPLTQQTLISGTTTRSGAGCILYFRFEPQGSSSALANSPEFRNIAGLLDYQDNPSGGEIRNISEGFDTEYHFAKSVAASSVQSGTKVLPGRWRSEDFVLISSGADRFFGHVKIGADGKPQAIRSGDDMSDFFCDDVTSFGK